MSAGGSTTFTPARHRAEVGIHPGAITVWVGEPISSPAYRPNPHWTMFWSYRNRIRTHLEPGSRSLGPSGG